MHFRFVLLFFVACPLGSAAAQQPSSCVTASDTSSMRFREDFADIATGTDDASAALRARYHLPLVADTAVVAVQDGHICAKALRALNKDQDASHAERRRLLLVVRVSDVFVVSDPTYKIGEWSATTVFDSSFKTVLARIAR